MRKFLLFLLLLSAPLLSEEMDQRTRFLFEYYDGDYEKAHKDLKAAFSDPTTVQIWEERIHQHQSITNCDYTSRSTAATQGFANLRIGNLKDAGQKFQDDARQKIDQALTAKPDNPELLYFAACTASTTQRANEYFTKFLAVPSENPLKRTTAEFSIDFNKKTEGIQLNSTSVTASPQKFDSQFRDGRLVIKTVLNDKEKLSLMIDTGAGGLTLEKRDWQPRIISDVVLTGFGKSQVTKATQGVFNVLTSNGVVVKNPVAAISPSFHSVGINGVAGTVLFSNYLILLPLKAQKDFLLFTPDSETPVETIEKAGYHFESAVTLPFELVNRMIILKGRIKKSGENMDILLDTGAQQSILSMSAAREFTRINIDSMRNRSSLTGVGGATSAVIAENVDIGIGELKGSFPRVLALNLADISEALELEIDMILGRDFLNGYTLLIDYSHSRVTFLK